MAGETLRIIPLGGVGEVGKNMTVYELDDDIVVVDAGLAFPRDEHLGVDLILPDMSYLADERIEFAPSSSRTRTRTTSARLPISSARSRFRRSGAPGSRSASPSHGWTSTGS